MIVAPDQVVRTPRRWAVGAAVVFAQIALALFFGIAGEDPLRFASDIKLAPASQGEQVAALKTEVTKEFVAPNEPMPEPVKHIEPIAAPLMIGPKATRSPVDDPQEQPATQVKAESTMPKDEAVSPAVESAVAGVAGPKAEESAPAAVQPGQNPAARPDESDGGQARESVAMTERSRPAPRGAPVVERSRVASPDQIKRIARGNEPASDCKGKWEGECRQFPDHKPNW
ncbi:MAG: hypothetical protein ACREVJ_16445 [Gammaproteobacteria bacterium]